MAWTAVKVWTTGYIVLASDMNTYLSDNTDYLKLLLTGTASLQDVQLGASGNSMTVYANATGGVTIGTGLGDPGAGILVVLNQGRFGDGTEALPGIAFRSNTEMGLRRIGADRMALTTAGADRWEISASGHLLAADDGIYNIGASGASRPQDLFISRNFTLGGTQSGGTTCLFSSRIQVAGSLSASFIFYASTNETVTDSYLIYGAEGTLTVNGASGNFAGFFAAKGMTVNATKTATRFSQLWASGITATVNGTLTDHNALFLGTPVNGTTVRVIDTSSGGYLTTAGIWTDNPSWANLKEAVRPVSVTELDSLLDWFALNHKPVQYRYKPKYEDVAIPAPKGKVTEYITKKELVSYDGKDDYDHFGYLLDDLPENIRKIVCVNAGGGISGKDERGLLLALVARLAQRVKKLEVA